MSFTYIRYAERCLRRTRDAFVELCGEHAARQRAAAIAQLPVVEWRGRALRTLRCAADFGRGPHNVNVPEYVCWALISLEHFRCPYHR